jgi:hypothetical protein
MIRAILILAFASTVSAASLAQGPSPLGPDHKVGGLNSADLSAEWWKWAMASPTESNPVRDISGKHCAVGQRGEVWFLAGGFGSAKIRRECAIPANRYLFFPIVNMVYWPREANSGYTCEQAKSSAALNNDTAIDLFASVDGIEISNVKAYRVRSDKCFDVFERVPRSFDPPSAFPSATDGYWLLLPPLAQGKHTIKFGGRYNRSSMAYGRMVQDIEYHLTVE